MVLSTRAIAPYTLAGVFAPANERAGVFLFVGFPSPRNVSWLGQLSANEHRDLVPRCAYLLFLLFLHPSPLFLKRFPLLYLFILNV